jgi:UDP-galactopyranose mutase
LEYRKTLYKFETYKQKSFQKNAVINFPNDFERTRITEFKHFYKEKYQKLSLGDNQKIENKTIICKEIP